MLQVDRPPWPLWFPKAQSRGDHPLTLRPTVGHGPLTIMLPLRFLQDIWREEHLDQAKPWFPLYPSITRKAHVDCFGGLPATAADSISMPFACQSLMILLGQPLAVLSYGHTRDLRESHLVQAEKLLSWPCLSPLRHYLHTQ